MAGEWNSSRVFHGDVFEIPDAVYTKEDAEKTLNGIPKDTPQKERERVKKAAEARIGKLKFFSEHWMEKVDASVQAGPAPPPPEPAFDEGGKRGWVKSKKFEKSPLMP
jgi:hypothetical protein